LEINPRLQVEHTVTEIVADIDLVRAQLLISQGASLEQAGINISTLPSILSQPPRYACQLRVTAEDVSKDWTLSVGKITTMSLPSGNGVRVDHAIAPGYTVGSSFDSLLAKIIVSGRTWEEIVRKAQRALNDTTIDGIKTNLNALRGIVSHPDFAAGDCDTRWLETKQAEILALGSRSVQKANLPTLSSSSLSKTMIAPIASGPPLFRRGDAWSVVLEPIDGSEAATTTNHIALTGILRNDFPSSLVSEIEFTIPSGDTLEYKLTLNNTTSSASAVTSQHRRGDANNPRHVVIPIPGKLVEILVDEGDIVKAEDVICVVQQMKMEIEIRARSPGRVVWVTEVEDGEEISEGLLAAEIEPLEAKL
jgi:pyruvate carboxylase